MKAKVIRSSEKGFEEVKHKIFEPVGLTKEEQLRLVFNRLFTGLLVEYGCIQYGGDNEEELKKKYTNLLMYEIKIRTKL